MGRWTKNLGIILFFVIVSIPLVWELFTPGYFKTHDGDFFVIRLIEFDKVMRAGQFPPRWAPDLNQGYGLPVFNFAYPGFLYLGEIFRLLNFSYTDSFKAIFILSFPLSAIGMYLFVSKLMGNLSGIISGLFYLFAPYRFLDVYVRGQIGEILVLTLVPYVFWVLISISEKNYRLYLILGSILLGLFFISHNIMVMIFTVIIIGYLLFLVLHQKFRSLLRKYLLLLLIGFCFASFFILPALLEKQNVALGQQVVVDYREHFPKLSQLIYSPWGYGFSENGLEDGMSFQIGLAHLSSFIFVVLSLGFLILKSKKISFENQNLLFFVGTVVLSLFLTLEVSKPVWDKIPYLSQIQFPWRLNALTVFSLSILAGGLWHSKFKYLLPILILLLVLNIRNYTRPSYYLRYFDKFYFNSATLYRGTNSIANEFSPVWVEEKPGNLTSGKFNIIPSQADLSNYQDLIITQKADIKVKTEKTEVEVNTAYYPGWEIAIDNQHVPTKIGKPFGTILFEVPEGDHQITAKFKETPLRLFSNLLFFAGLLLLTAALIVLK